MKRSSIILYLLKIFVRQSNEDNKMLVDDFGGLRRTANISLMIRFVKMNNTENTRYAKLNRQMKLTLTYSGCKKEDLLLFK